MTDGGPVPGHRTLPDYVAVPALIGAMLLMLVSMPVTVPVAVLLDRHDRRRLRAAALATSCVRCGHPLGAGAPEASDEAFMAELAEARRQHPHVLLRVARHAHARCTSCGADYAWDAKQRTLRPVPYCPCDQDAMAPRAIVPGTTTRGVDRQPGQELDPVRPSKRRTRV